MIKQRNEMIPIPWFGRGVGSQNYEFWVHCMFLVLVPWVTIFTLNMLIIRQVWASGDKMSGNTSPEKRHIV
jgi:hypothetical protein